MNRPSWYILDEHGKPRRARGWRGADHGFFAWAEWRTRKGEGVMVVRQEDLPRLWISTVFLGMDHGWRGPPILWETFVFSRKGRKVGALVENMRCTGNRAQAEAMHARTVAFWRKKFSPRSKCPGVRP